jgi:hypothetical protein
MAKSLCYDARIMRRSFKIGVALTVLIAVAAVLIAPTIVMPMTTLRAHHVSSHANGGQANDTLNASSNPGLPHLLPSAFGSQISVSLRSPNRALSLPPLVLLC